MYCTPSERRIGSEAISQSFDHNWSFRKGDWPSLSKPYEILETMTLSFSYVWLLPLLEKPYEAVKLDLPVAVSALEIKGSLPAEISLHQLLVTALESDSEYWSRLAIKWLDEGFPVNHDLSELLLQCSSRKTLSQSIRHKAFSFTRRGEKLNNHA